MGWHFLAAMDQMRVFKLGKASPILVLCPIGNKNALNSTGCFLNEILLRDT